MSRGAGCGNRRAAIAGLLLACGALGAGGDLRGQSPRVTIEPDTTEIHVGDPLALRLAVDHPADFAVRWPDSLSLGPFEALALEVSPPEASAVGARTAAVLHVTAFELGELEIPSFILELTDGGGGTTTVSTDPVVIGVTTVGLDEGGDIRDVTGPRAIARNWLLLWPWFLLAAALAGLSYWWGSRRRRRSDRIDSRPPVPTRPPHEIALEALDRLEASPLLERGENQAVPHRGVPDHPRLPRGSLPDLGAGDGHAGRDFEPGTCRRGPRHSNGLRALSGRLRPREVREMAAG